MSIHLMLIGVPTEAGPPTNPVNIVLDIVGFISQLLGFGGPNIQALTASINGTWGNLVVSTSFLYNSIGAVLGFLRKLLGTVVSGLSHIVTDILHGHLLKALQDIQALLRALHNLFAPLLAWLRKLQQMQRQMQLQAMKRVIDLIQRARKFLVVFKLLHIKWATKLDNFLAGVEGKIIARELDIVRKTNELIGWVNLVTDPFGTLRTASVFAPFGASLRGIMDALRAVDAQALFPGLTQVWTSVPAGAPGPLPQLPGPAHPPVQIP